MSWILNDGNQIIGVLLILAGAVGYLTLYFRRTIKGSGCGCKSGCGAQPKRLATTADAGPASAAKPFVPLENLADRAARIRESQEETKPTREDTPPAP